jgi:acyl-CoA synthetase (AMP-forming)/AMP-acid ligase II
MSFLGVAASGALAVVDPASGERLPYAELVRRGTAIAAALGGTKQLVFVAARNTAACAATYWGAMDAGHAVALLDGHAADEVTAALVDTYRPAWLAGPADLPERLSAAGVDIAATRDVAGVTLIRTGAAGPGVIHPDLGLLLTTSGTTGSRKLVRLRSANVEANARSIAECLSLGADDRPLAALPIHYSFGLSVLNSHWQVGATVVLSDDSVLQRQLWDVFDDEMCTSLAGVPYTYQLLERVGFREMPLPSLRSLQQAGGALDRRLAALYRDHMAARNGRFYVMYGQTEATARIAVVPPDRLGDKLGSAGLPIPGGRLRIERDAAEAASSPAAAGDPRTATGGEPHPAGGEGVPVVGELVYEGPNVMLGYATSAADLALGDELGGVLRTGDVGYLDAEGFAYLVGRSKRIAKVFGHRVNLDEVEALVREAGPAAVVGAPEAIWGFCAFGTQQELDDLGRRLAQRLRLHHSAFRFRRVEAIPTTGSGKVDYRVVQAWVE